MFIKRRDPVTGLFESNFLEISSDVVKWGKVRNQIDAVRLNKLKMGNMRVLLNNDSGRYNTNESPNSLWFNFANQQRTLVKIQAGFLHQTQAASGIWINTKFPSDGSKWDTDDLWDVALWDDPEIITFTGIISGDNVVSDKNETSFNIRPLNQIFRDFSARNIVGYDDSMTASKFITLLRDQTDGSSNFIFRPFFGDTTTNWNISTTTVVYPELNTGTASDVRDKNVWEIIERLAEAENHIAYINNQGIFTFKSRTDVGTATAYEFHGLNSGNTEFGHTVKQVKVFGAKISKFYSRVEIRHDSADTDTSLAIVESSLTVSGANTSWVLGQRTLKIDNTWIPAATADSIASTIFTEVSALKKEISYNTSFITQLDILDKVTITYNSGEFSFDSLWDIKNWGDDTANILPGDLLWAAETGDSIDFTDKEFKLLSYEIDLDKLESNFICREV